MSLAHNGHNQLSDSHTGERDSVWSHNGLSQFGKKVIAEMNKWGIMVDISHPSKASMMQTIQLSKAPVIASHSAARALSNESRNLDDEQLKAIKENGGVVQTVGLGTFVNTEKARVFREKREELLNGLAQEQGFRIIPRSEMYELSEKEREDYMTRYRELVSSSQSRIDSLKEAVPVVTVSDFVDHIDYMVNLIGIDHVGISSDFDGGGGIEGWSDASETFNVTLELVKRGYTEEEISKIWSGNLLRVLDKVQEIAQKIQENKL